MGIRGSEFSLYNLFSIRAIYQLQPSLPSTLTGISTLFVIPCYRRWAALTWSNVSVIPKSQNFLNADTTGLGIRGKEAAQADKEAGWAFCLRSYSRPGFEKNAKATSTALSFRESKGNLRVAGLIDLYRSRIHSFPNPLGHLMQHPNPITH